LVSQPHQFLAVQITGQRNLSIGIGLNSLQVN